MVIGDVDFVAFEYVVNSEKEKLGRVFLFIKGVRYGADEFDYELLDLAKGFSYEINEKSRNFPQLLNFDAKEISSLRDCVLEDYESDGCGEYKAIGISDSDLDDIFFYSPHYMLDAYGVALVQGEKEERLYLYDDSVYVDIKLERGYFYKLISQLVSELVV